MNHWFFWKIFCKSFRGFFAQFYFIYYQLNKQFLTLVSLGIFYNVFHWGGGAKFAHPPVFGPNRALTKKNIKEHLKLRLFWANFASSTPLKNVSKYPKLAFQKSQLNILQKIEKLVKIEKNVKLAYKILKWKIVWWFL